MASKSSRGSVAPLHQQLVQAAGFVQAVLAGKSSRDALGKVPREHHRAAQALGFATLRQWGLAQTLLTQLAPRPPDKEVAALMWVSLTLLCSDDEETSLSYDAFTVVDQTIRALKSRRHLAHASGFVNACLRRFLRERAPLLTQAQLQALARWNHPEWWVARLRADYPDHWQDLLRANRRRAPLVLRTAPDLGNTEPLRSGQSPLQATRLGEFAWAIPTPTTLQDLDGFSEGRLSVQDAAAQLAAPLLLRSLSPQPDAPGRPYRILDACAAPGGKTTHLIEFGRHLGLALEVTALEIDPDRVPRIHENLARCRMSARVLTADAGKPETWWDGQPFDAILLDAPCSASGIVRRHPDVPWLRRPADIEQLCDLQARLLDALWPLLTPGGSLLYATCSQFKAEGVDQVRAFLSRNNQAHLQASPGHLLPGIHLQETLMPDNSTSTAAPNFRIEVQTSAVREHDGFFYALFVKPPGLPRPET